MTTSEPTIDAKTAANLTPDQWRNHLQQIWQDHFPITAAMAITVESYKPGALVVSAELAPNTNIHGTAFAGSLYSVQALTCWGLLYLELKRRQIDASIILASSKIDYHTTVTAGFEAHCQDPELAAAFDQLTQQHKLRRSLTSSVTQDSVSASLFSGEYVLRMNPPPQSSSS